MSNYFIALSTADLNEPPRVVQRHLLVALAEAEGDDPIVLIGDPDRPGVEVERVLLQRLVDVEKLARRGLVRRVGDGRIKRGPRFDDVQPVLEAADDVDVELGDVELGDVELGDVGT